MIDDEWMRLRERTDAVGEPRETYQPPSCTVMVQVDQCLFNRAPGVYWTGRTRLFAGVGWAPFRQPETEGGLWGALDDGGWDGQWPYSITFALIGDTPEPGDVLPVDWTGERWVSDYRRVCYPVLSVCVTDESEHPVVGATVSLRTLPGAVEVATCETGANGCCTITGISGEIGGDPPDPTEPATVDEAGGGTSGGTLQQRAYRVAYIWVKTGDKWSCRGPMSRLIFVGSPNPNEYPVPPWGVIAATGPRGAAPPSALTAGTYQVCYTYMDAAGESKASSAAQFHAGIPAPTPTASYEGSGGSAVTPLAPGTWRYKLAVEDGSGGLTEASAAGTFDVDSGDRGRLVMPAGSDRPRFTRGWRVYLSPDGAAYHWYATTGDPGFVDLATAYDATTAGPPTANTTTAAAPRVTLPPMAIRPRATGRKVYIRKCTGGAWEAWRVYATGVTTEAYYCVDAYPASPGSLPASNTTAQNIPTYTLPTFPADTIANVLLIAAEDDTYDYFPDNALSTITRCNSLAARLLDTPTTPGPHEIDVDFYTLGTSWGECSNHSHRIVVSAPGCATESHDFRMACRGVTTRNIVLDCTTEVVTICVTDCRGGPVSGAEVTLAGVGSCETEANGCCTIAVSGTGTATLSITPPGGLPGYTFTNESVSYGPGVVITRALSVLSNYVCPCCSPGEHGPIRPVPKSMEFGYLGATTTLTWTAGVWSGVITVNVPYSGALSGPCCTVDEDGCSADIYVEVTQDCDDMSPTYGQWRLCLTYARCLSSAAFPPCEEPPRAGDDLLLCMAYPFSSPMPAGTTSSTICFWASHPCDEVWAVLWTISMPHPQPSEMDGVATFAEP